jgi:hypothetical protein
VRAWAVATLVLAAAAVVMVPALRVEAQQRAEMVEWPVDGDNLASLFHSPLDTINARNVKDLKVA